MGSEVSSNILIFGGTGYIGSYMVKASIYNGHPTYVYSRPDCLKTDLLQEFQSMGVKLIKGALPHPGNVPVAILHSIFVKGVLISYKLAEDDLEASRLYPDLKYTTIEQLLDIFLHNPPKPASAAFE
ncbi:eugenol synthase 1-like [Cornus florida]|uniref:eugenol synthase 1-like n=1 Tax=Cornus florida TaxID=4283 RepID=UPI00289ED60B|nr:eugenol synthase 1-like [Cornus florida]